MTPEEVLLKAAGIVERDGWHQGYYYPEDDEDQAADEQACLTGPVCAMGAIRRAMTGLADRAPHGPECRVFVTTRNLLRKHVGDMVPHWNDDPQRTKEDVVLALKRAAHGDVVAQ